MDSPPPYSSQDVAVEHRGPIGIVTLNRPAKRNAINDSLIEGLRRAFAGMPASVRCVILRGEGSHFCSGLDLSEQVHREPEDVLSHSRNWHAVMDMLQFGGPPIIALMNGAVMGGGLELAAACHVRIAESSAIYQLPEGKRGIFVGGGATVRIGRILGPDRMTEMMLTGRRYDAEDGQRLGLSHYLVAEGGGMDKALALADEISANASLVNKLIIHGLAHISDMPRQSGFFAESLSAALSQTGPDAREGLSAFLEKRKPRFR